MLKVAILDDYQNVSQQFVDIEKLSGKYEIKIFSEPFEDEADALDKLSDFEALLVMRERTPITKNLIENLTKLRFIITSGLRNKSIDLEAAKKRKIIVSGTESNLNPTPELTWALILGLARNIKEEIDNMYQGYWQTTLGTELKGKILGLIGLGKVGSEVAKIGNAFGIGSKVYIYYGDDKHQMQEILAGGGSQSFNEAIVWFGLGKYTSVSRIKIVWSTKS